MKKNYAFSRPKNTQKATAFLTVTFLSLLALPARAGTMHNGWNYSIDSVNDSIEGNAVGGTAYEIFGTAVKQTQDELIFAINANMPLGGVASPWAADGHTGWGDVLLNFSGASLDAVNNNGDLFAIRFANNNGSGVPELGFYGGVTAKSVAKENGLLLNNLADYNSWVRQNGKTPSIGDLSADSSYFNQSTHVPNVIASGNKIGDINLVSDLSSLGLDFGAFNALGTQTLAFSVARSLLPESRFNLLYHLGVECNNDLIAGELMLEDFPPETPEKVPEPSGLLGVAMVGLMLGGSRLRKFLNSWSFLAAKQTNI